MWILQVLELAIAYLLISQSAHVAGGALLAVSGILLGLLTLSVDAPLGVIRVCSPRVHLFAVRVLAIATVVGLAVPASRPDAEGIVVVLIAAAALIVLSTRASAASGSRRRRRQGRDNVPIDATATVSIPRPDPASAESDASDSAMRKAGRATGAAAGAGKRVVDEHRPVVEAKVKRSLRGAGRLAARITAPKPPPDTPA